MSSSAILITAIITNGKRDKPEWHNNLSGRKTVRNRGESFADGGGGTMGRESRAEHQVVRREKVEHHHHIVILGHGP